MLYESYIHPVTILSGLPSAAVGALAMLWLFDRDLSIIAMIGILMLIGIVKKNAIMMTTTAALMGALPIAMGLGAGAELLGLAVVWGLLFSQVITLFITPVIYLYLDHFSGQGPLKLENDSA